MSEKELYPEQPKYDKGAAPKISREMVMNAVNEVHYVNAYDAATDNLNKAIGVDKQFKRVTLCLMSLHNGAVIVGTSQCAHIDNFDEDKGMQAAYDDAIRQAWTMIGFALRDRLGRMQSYQDHDGTTRDPDGNESFEQLRWKMPGAPAHSATPVQKVEPGDVARATVNVGDKTYVIESKAGVTVTLPPTDTVRLFGKGNKVIGEVVDMKWDGEKMVGTCKFTELKPVGQQPEIGPETKKAIEHSVAFNANAPRNDKATLEELTKLINDFFINNPGHFDRIGDVRTKFDTRPIMACDCQFCNPEGESIEYVINQQMESIAAAFGLPVYVLLGNGEDRPGTATDEVRRQMHEEDLKAFKANQEEMWASAKKATVERCKLEMDIAYVRFNGFAKHLSIGAISYDEYIEAFHEYQAKRLAWETACRL